MQFPGFRNSNPNELKLGAVMNKDEFDEYLKNRKLRPMNEAEYKVYDDERSFIYDLNSEKIVRSSKIYDDDTAKDLIEKNKLLYNKEVNVNTADKKD
jgi:hypothetical protein